MHQRCGLAKRRYQFSKIHHKIGPTEKQDLLKKYVHKLRDTNWKLKPIENAKKIQHAHHGRHEVKDLQENHECAKIPINNKTSTHEINLDPSKNYK